MAADSEGDDLTLLKALRAKVRPMGGSAAKVRHAADSNSKMKDTDGRRKRGNGMVRDAQINFKVSSETKAEIVDTAKRLNKPMVWVLERGLELVLAEDAGQKAGKS